MATSPAPTELKKDKLLSKFCDRFSTPPFTRELLSIELWTQLWPSLDRDGKRILAELPNPCIKHVESRLGKPERASNLKLGFQRLVGHDQTVFLEGLRLYPHTICRTAEVIGPLKQEKWSHLETKARNHRLWGVRDELSDEEFWLTAESLEDFRELPQPVLDFLELQRDPKSAPILEFKSSLKRFILRQKIEKIRSFTYELQRVHQPVRVIEASSTTQ